MLASLAILLASCNCYNKMLKKVDRVSVSATPAVLTLKGSNVVTDVRVDFPAKYFNKKAVLKVTPVLVFEGGELVGTPKFIQGEKVKDNYTVIPYKTGGSYTQAVSFRTTNALNFRPSNCVSSRSAQKAAKNARNLLRLQPSRLPKA